MRLSHIAAAVGFAATVLIAQSCGPAFAEKKCGSESCGAPTKAKKTINGVVYNCDVTVCSKSCCSLADPPVCSIEKTTKNDCTVAQAIQGQRIQKLPTAPAARQ